MPNRLARESSPYLLQHANNPVDWRPWGEEAVAEARRRDVPIFLSIGYSTCYWCHVMERESFESEAIARQMNEHFVCVKLDREERPDVDEAYMAATVMMAGHGGWPMSVFLEPAGLRPFFCGTYFPAEPRPGMPTFPKVLEAMAGAWRTQREGVLSQAAQIGELVAQHLGQAPPATELGQAQVADAVSSLLRMFDRAHGGFGAAPKFPQVVFLEFLMDVRDRAADDSTADAIDIALKKSLDHMALGGIHDFVGGGFHRYSVDASWTVPHFEKMLYDQAQLLAVYARAAGRYADAFYAWTARRLADYVLREMTDAQGGFHSAQDAEVDGREGLNYLWTPGDLAGAGLGEDEPLVRRALGLDGPANFRDPHHEGEPARHVLRLSDRPERVAPLFELPPGRFLERLDRAFDAMRKARERRPRPRQDDKVIAAWNGMMIAALAVASNELEEPKYLAAAERAADFVLRSMRRADAGLRRTWRAGTGGAEGVLEDSAWMIAALAALARLGPADRREERLAAAQELAERAVADFGDGSGALFDTPSERRDLFVRARSTHDGATPCGISVMIHALLDLAHETGRREHVRRALAALAAVSGRVAESPVGSANSVRALFRLLVASELEPGPQARESAGTPPATEPVVRVLAESDRVVVTPDAPSVLHLVLDISEGWHVAAADPGSSPASRALTPLRVDITGGGGVRAFADYPPGVPYGAGEGAIRVYRGRIELKIALERHGEWKGRPLLVLRYQACSDRECLSAEAVELDIAIDRGG